MTTSFEWLPEYSVGDSELDRQHQQIIAILNDLTGVISAHAKPDSPAVEQIFDELASYITTHFAHEEERMVEAGYPVAKVDAHRKNHNTLLATVQQYQQRCATGDEQAFADLMPFLYGDWLIQHICEIDMDYAPFMAKGGNPVGAPSPSNG